MPPSRREFLAAAGALGLSAEPALGKVLEFLRRRPVTSIEADRAYWTAEGDQTICSLCPLNCHLSPGET